MVTSQVQSRKQEVVEVSPEIIERWLKDGDTVLVDVREDFEHAEERIGGAEHAPLSKLDAEAIRLRYPGSRIVFHCKSGKRSAQAAGRLCELEGQAFHLAGGIEGWKQSGRATVKPVKGPRLPVMRQVQLVAGGLVALGALLGFTVSPWFHGLSAFVGCGLMFAGATGWCGMALILAKMPWNKSLAAKGASCCAK